MKDLDAARQRLLESEPESAEFAIRGAGLGTWALELACGRLRCSERCAALAGLTLAELGPHLSSWTDRVHPDDRTRLGAFLDGLRQQGSGSHSAELRVRHQEGHWVRVLCQGGLVASAPDGSPLWAAGTVADITADESAREALRETHELLSLFLRHSPIHAYIKEVSVSESRVLQASENFRQMIGIPGSEMVGKTMQELFPSELAAEMTAADRAVVSGGKVLRFEEELAGKSYSTVKFPLTLGGRTLLAGYTIDVTERRQAEEARIALERHLLQAQKQVSLGVMAGGIAHRFNNLLTTIGGNLELARAVAAPSMELLLADAEDAVRGAAAISGSLLSYLGQGVRHREPRQLGREVMDLLPLIRASLPAGVGLEVDLAHDLPRSTVDPGELRHVLLSLVTNAWEAMMAAGGVVRIAARRVSSFPGRAGRESPAVQAAAAAPVWGAGGVCLEVGDTGPGMDVSTQERIFDPFFSTKFAGRGLGLSATLGVVRASGGTIVVESAPDKGTTVRVYLPESTPRELAARPSAVAEPRFGEALRVRRSGAVLVVDDDPAVLHASQRLLQRLGQRVILATSGEQAVELFTAQMDGIGLVLLDLAMPGMDGWEVLAALRRLRPSTYVVVASGCDLAALRSEPREVEPDGWLQKPFCTKDLSAFLAPAQVC